MITTTYKCDRCGHTQDNPTQMWNVAVKSGCYPYSADTIIRGGHWCRSCMEALRILPADPPLKPDLPVPTLEEMIREFIREEIQNA